MYSQADRDVIQRDRRLPGLATLLDSGRFTTELQGALPEAEIGPATINYLRYKPGVNCLAKFQVHINGQQVEGYAKAYGWDEGDKLMKANQRSSVPTTFGPGRVILDAPGIEVAFFPNDTKLPTLAHLVITEKRKRLLKRLVPAEHALEDAEIRSLRYKPERRYVGQVALGDDTALLKLYSRRGFEEARSASKVLRDGDVLQVPGVTGRSHRRQAILWEWIPGQPLIEHIAGDAVNRDAMHRVGVALGELHRQPAKGLSVQSSDVIRERYHAVMDGLVWLVPELAASLATLRQRLDGLLDAESSTRTPIHADFYAAQVLVNGPRIGIVDLDNTILGNPASDLGLFVAHLERNAITSGRPVAPVELVRDLLHEGYSSEMPLPDEASLALHTAIGLVHLAPHHFRNREPAWEQRTAVTIARAEALADEAARAAGVFLPAGGVQ